MQVAAHEARQGHGKLAQELRDLIDGAKAKGAALEKKVGPVPIVQPKGELANLLTAHYITTPAPEPGMNPPAEALSGREAFSGSSLNFRHSTRIASKPDQM